MARQKQEINIADRLIAHRGDAVQYPENTLPAIESALAAGVCNIELDLQLTADRVPVLFHDTSLERMMGISGSVGEFTAAEFLTAEAAYRIRFGEKFSGTRPASLELAVTTLAEHPEVTLFLEIKRVTLQQFGIEETVGIVLESVEHIINPIVLLSFSQEAVQVIRDQSEYSTGWVLDSFNDAYRDRAHELSPDFLFCNKIKINTPLWPGIWKWIIYEVESVDSALDWLSRGAHFVESMRPWELLKPLSNPSL